MYAIWCPQTAIFSIQLPFVNLSEANFSHFLTSCRSIWTSAPGCLLSQLSVRSLFLTPHAVIQEAVTSLPLSLCCPVMMFFWRKKLPGSHGHKKKPPPQCWFFYEVCKPFRQTQAEWNKRTLEQSLGQKEVTSSSHSLPFTDVLRGQCTEYFHSFHIASGSSDMGWWDMEVLGRVLHFHAVWYSCRVD